MYRTGTEKGECYPQCVPAEVESMQQDQQRRGPASCSCNSGSKLPGESCESAVQETTTTMSSTES